MDIKSLAKAPLEKWPRDSKKIILKALLNSAGNEEERLLAAGVAYTIVDDEMAAALLSVVEAVDAPTALRARAAIALGPALEEADAMGFDDLEDGVISEKIFGNIQKSFRDLYDDTKTPKEVRRRVLEASVRAPEPWHSDAVKAAYADDDVMWRLTAVFSMNFIKEFEEQIMESLESDHSEIHIHAVEAAGSWEIEDAWPHVKDLLSSPETGKDLLLTAIEAVPAIQPSEAEMVLGPHLESKDEDVVDAAHEAIFLSNSLGDLDYDDDLEEL